MHTFLRAGTAAVVGATAIVASAATAGADPNGEATHLSCGGAEYEVVVTGNGEFTPAHDLGSTTMFVPTAFGAFTGTLTDLTDDVVVFTESDPGGATKGNSQARGRTTLHCTYSFEDHFVAGPDDEGLVEGHHYLFAGEGDVTGFASGPR